MIHAQAVKYASCIVPQSIGTTEVTGATVDTNGFDYAVAEFYLDSAAASSVPTTIALYEGAATDAVTTAVDITTGGLLVATVPHTSLGQVIPLFIDLRKRARYLTLGFASTTARLASAKFTLSRAAEMPASITEVGAADMSIL